MNIVTSTLRRLGFRADDGDRSPWGNFWFTPVGIRSGAGARVTPETAMQLSVVFACVRLISESFAALPFVLYKRRSDGGKTIVTDHWLYDLLGKRPNRWQNRFEWREMMQGHLCLRGNAFNQIVPDRRGGIAELLPIHPDRVRVEILDNLLPRYRIKNSDGSELVLPRGEVWHIRGFSSDGYCGLSPIEVTREAIGNGLSAQGYSGRFWANDAKPSGGWIELPGKFKDNEAKKEFRESWQALQSGLNKGKVAVLEGGMKYHEIGVTNDDAQFLETLKHYVVDICRIFRVPPHKIGELDRATFSNIEQQSLDFIQDCLNPWSVRWEASIEDQLVPDDEDLQVEFDFTSLMRGDAAARAAYYHSGITDGWLTRNGARIAENLNPLPGLDKPLMPLNMVTLDKDGNAEASKPDSNEGGMQTPARPGKAPAEPGEPDQDDTDPTSRKLRQ